MRDHGGNLDAAQARWGGGPWVDLSTGINRVPYPLPDLPGSAWTDLPTRAAMDLLTRAARTAYGTQAAVLPVAGAQAAIQMVPGLAAPGRAAVLSPTYNEHAAALREAGWQVDPVTRLADLAGADLAVVVNPNNPDGQTHAPQALRDLAGRVGQLIVDESFADPVPHLSIAADPGPALVLRSFGKFYGLAGLRLGFVIGAPDRINGLARRAGPWPVSGAAIAIGCAALTDRAWQAATTARLARDAARLDALTAAAGWSLVGGAHLFRLYHTPDAAAAQERLARGRIWSRIFPWHDHWLRLGLPGSVAEWAQLGKALT
ncbi:threonine-phosphate decarboxylase CobD [Paracoccus sp. p4-l81]|uniref:threonine-phosphate decarboxylase CobD n=1 Tax=Paracoccus sp. p4-l81 TaxID=3342806 RepID=UPI0035BA4741